jgi:hypothetical protein
MQVYFYCSGQDWRLLDQVVDHFEFVVKEKFVDVLMNNPLQTIGVLIRNHSNCVLFLIRSNNLKWVLIIFLQSFRIFLVINLL